MRELSFSRKRNRYLFPIAILRPATPHDLTNFAATALLDTGATVSGIGPRVVHALGLESYGKNRLRSATEEVFANYYLFKVGLFTTDQLNEPMGNAVSLPYIIDEFDGFSWTQHGDFDVILGMDVLSRCDITLSRKGTCQIVFD